MKISSFTRNLLIAGAAAALMTVSAFAGTLQGGTVKTSSAVHFREEASTSAASFGKLGNETRVAVLSEAENGWYKIAYRGKVGFMSADYLEVQDIMNIECGGVKVTTSVLNLRSGPGTENSIVAKLSKDTVGKIIGINNGWFKIQANGHTGYISPDYVEIVPFSGSASNAEGATASGTRQQIVDFALGLKGCKYVYGGSSKKGFDCSGFSMYVYANYGVSLSHSSATQYKNSTHIKRSELQLGDLIFFSQTKGGSKVGHVGIYIGNGQFVHAASPGKGVRVDDIDSSYYSSHYVGCGRVLSD